MLRQFSVLPAQAAAVLVSLQPPKYQLLKNPPSFIKTAEKKIHMRYGSVRTSIEADGVRGSICHL